MKNELQALPARPSAIVRGTDLPTVCGSAHRALTLNPYLVGIFVFVARIRVVSALENGDDFSNNLFSDLAPILALFGEQVAKQFMAGSLGWSDNILFAMAPLGIITAIVGAIRIGGPGWLRGIVGRARENRPAAEVELTTSTSSDVCELWNGKAIVRMIGAPKITQLIFFPDTKPDAKPEDGLFTVKTALESGKLEERSRDNWGASFITSKLARLPETKKQTRIRRRRVLCSDEESQSRPSSATSQVPTTASASRPASAPNVSLNLSPTRNTWELRLSAAFGVLLQAGVIVFSAFATYNERLKDKIGGEESFPYGYPLAATGTVVLVLGMLICSFVVEASTREAHYETQGSQFRILWLQQGENVNDQVFDSYAIFGEKLRKSVMNSSLDDNKQPTGSIYTETIVVVGALLSVAGFIIQFTGFRGMHWSASVAQLTATLVMVVLRAIVRRGMVISPHIQRIPHGHELDWLATRFARDRDREELWKTQDNTTEQCRGAATEQSDSSVVDNISFWSEGCWNWGIVTASDTDDFRFYENRDGKHPDDVVRVREHIGRLTKWTVGLSDAAVSLANSIGVAMNLLVPYKGGEKRLYWPMRGRGDGLIFLSVRYENGRWRASATEIDAVLSLWMYTAWTEQKKPRDTKTSEASANREVRPIDKHSTNRSTVAYDDWLTTGDNALRQTNIRLLGRIEPKYIRDLSWYVGDRMAEVVEAEEILSPKARLNSPGDQTVLADSPGSAPTSSTALPLSPSVPESDIIQVDHNRVVGFTASSKPPANDSASTVHNPRRFRIRQHRRQDEEKLPQDKTIQLPDNSSSEDKRHVLAIVSDSPIHELFIQDMFSTFMWAVANKVEPLHSNTAVHQDGNNWRSFRLENSILSRVVNEVQRAASGHLGNLNDIYFSVVPPLSHRQKLPIPFCLLEHVMAVADSYEAIGHWKESAEVYLWFFQKCVEFGPKHRLGVKATALLFETHRMVVDIADISEKQKRSVDDIKGLEDVAFKLQEALETADRSVVGSLQRLYDIRTKQPSEFDGFEGATTLHGEVRQDREWEWGKRDQSRAIAPGTDLLGMMPVHYAALIGKKGAMGYLLKSDHDHTCTDSVGWTPLHYAVAFGHKDIVKPLLGKRALQNGVTLRDISGKTPLHYVKTESIAWELLQEGAQLDIQGRDGTTALHCAASEGRLEIVRLFIEAGVNVDILDRSRRSPLHWAAYRGHEDIVKLLVEKGASLTARDDNGRIPLHLAAVAGGLTENMFRLLEAQRNLATNDRGGLTALHFAAIAGEQNSVKLTLADKSNADARDRTGMTALHHAASGGHEATARMLVSELKADVEAKNNGGWTALHYAASGGHEATARMLVSELKADVKAKGDYGQTALHHAAYSGHEATARMLVSELKADVEAKDKDGRTALRLGEERGRESIAQLLATFRTGHNDTTNETTPIISSTS